MGAIGLIQGDSLQLVTGSGPRARRIRLSLKIFRIRLGNKWGGDLAGGGRASMSGCYVIV